MGLCPSPPPPPHYLGSALCFLDLRGDVTAPDLASKFLLCSPFSDAKHRLQGSFNFWSVSWGLLGKKKED